jgi:N-acetylmuramic acid 6-phosphate etherase
MKAGTAQRVALNLLFTLVMIRLGRVHQGLMVDVQAINAKLVARSESILQQLTGRSADDAREALQRAGGNIKIAVLLLQGVTAEHAAALIEEANGQLRTALKLAAAAGHTLSSAAQAPSADAGAGRKMVDE